MKLAQHVWFDRLREATQFNQWAFSQIYPYLKGQVLEVGCGSGNFTELIAPVCGELVAVDLNQTYVELAIARLNRDKATGLPPVNVFVADATVYPWTQTFDTIIMLDVLEHIADDVDSLERLSQYLAPGGTMILKVPAIEALYNSMDQAVGHYRRYTPERLQTVLADASLVNPVIWYFNMAGIPGWWWNGAVLGRVTPSPGQIGWFDRCVPLFEAIESHLPCPIGLSLFAVAQRAQL